MTQQAFGLAGVMGRPVAYSRSPQIHNYWLQKYGIKGACVQLAVQPGNLAVAPPSLSALGFRGCNITIPHKVDTLKLVHAVDANAQRAGAVNTIVLQADGSLKGMNTDGFGYIQSLLDAKPDWRADTGPVAVLGAGGAARDRAGAGGQGRERNQATQPYCRKSAGTGSRVWRASKSLAMERATRSTG